MSQQETTQNCSNCEQEVIADEIQDFFDYKQICDECRLSIENSDRETAPVSVNYSDDLEYTHTIGSYHDDTDGAFGIAYTRIDGWRGYYTVHSDSWTSITAEQILFLHPNTDNQEKQVGKILDAFDDKDIEYAKVFSATSNVCSTSFDLFVRNEDVKKATKIVASLKE